MQQQDVFGSTQMILFNPILEESLEIRTQYFVYLRELIHLAKWDKGKYTRAQIAFYEERLCADTGVVQYQKPSFDPCYSFLFPFDLSIMAAFHKKAIDTDKSERIVQKIVSDFNLPNEATTLLKNGFKASLGDESAWNSLLRLKALKPFKKYLDVVKKNAMFLQKKPYTILVTATMSAGKSTLINALVGKNICRAQTLACTSKIHAIVSKPFEDGVSSKCGHDLSIDAAKADLLNDHDDNTSSKRIVGTHFDGRLSGQRMILLDSPGVNASRHMEHAEIAQKMIRSKKYNLLIYVLNATQLGTTDDEQHLKVVAKYIGRTRIIFVMNKTDCLLSDDDNLIDEVQQQREFLVSIGFQNPIICPISSRAAFLAKKSHTEGLSRLEQREMENYMDKFERESLQEYYIHTLNCSLESAVRNDMQILLRNCGFAYFEKLIFDIQKGGNTNGSRIC